MNGIEVRIVTLGTLEAARIGTAGPQEITGRQKPLCLLVYLLLGQPPGQFHERTSLCALFWPESDEHRARASLRQALRTIEEGLAPVLERRGRGQIRVRPGSVSIDALDFREAVSAGHWERAVRLYGGPFLDGVHVPDAADFERWADRAQLQLTAGYKTALRGLASEAGDEVGALTRSRLWDELSALAPYDAGAALSLARALDGTGNAREARTALSRFLQRLRTDTTLEPPASVIREMRRLGEAADAALPEAAPAGQEAAPDDAGHSWSPLLRRGLFAVGVVGILSFGASLSFPAPEPPSKLRLAVPPLLGQGESARRHALSLIVGEELSRLEGVEVVPYHVLTQRLGWQTTAGGAPSPEVLRDVARGLDVDLLILGTVLEAGGPGPELVLDVVDLDADKTVGPSILPDPDAGDAARDVGARAATRIADVYARPPAARGDHAGTPTPPVLGAYLAFARALEAFAAGDVPGAEAHARRALEIDPDFAPARIELATQRTNQGDFEAAARLTAEVRGGGAWLTRSDRERLDWLEAVLAGDRERRLAVVESGGPWWTRHQLAWELTGLGRPTEANAVLEDDGRGGWRPEFLWRETASRAVNHHLLSEHRAELALLRRQREVLAGVGVAARFEARALAAAGRVSEAEGLVAELEDGAGAEEFAELAYEVGIELLAHGFESRGLGWLERAAEAVPSGVDPGTSLHRLRANALYASGQWKEAQAAFEAVLAQRPGDVHARGALAVIEARTGDPDRARAAGEALANGGPWANAGDRTIWQARIAAALGDGGEVARLLELAGQRGAARPGWSHTFPEWPFLNDPSVLDRWLDVS